MVGKVIFVFNYFFLYFLQKYFGCGVVNKGYGGKLCVNFFVFVIFNIVLGIFILQFIYVFYCEGLIIGRFGWMQYFVEKFLIFINVYNRYCFFIQKIVEEIRYRRIVY